MIKYINDDVGIYLYLLHENSVEIVKTVHEVLTVITHQPFSSLFGTFVQEENTEYSILK